MEETAQDSALSRFRVAVIGVGGIGSAYAFQFATVGGHDVTAVARPGSKRLQQLTRDRGVVKTNGERAEMRVTDALDEETPYDLVIVTLLAHQVDAVLPALTRSAAKCVLFLFNNFDPERLRDALGAERCAFGMPFIQAFIDADGRLDAKIGAGGQKTKISDALWVEVFQRAGVPAVLEPKMLLWLRCHAPLCIAFESASVAGVRRGGGAAWNEAMMLGRGVKESFALIRGLGYPIYPAGKSILAGSPAGVVAAMLWGVTRIRSFRELLATGVGECRALVDVLVAAAPRARPAVMVGRIEAMKPVEESL
jgi:2-dehydropantoate 2-reductase